MARSGWDSTNAARASSRMYEGADLGSMTPWPRPFGGNGGGGEGLPTEEPLETRGERMARGPLAFHAFVPGAVGDGREPVERLRGVGVVVGADARLGCELARSGGSGRLMAVAVYVLLDILPRMNAGDSRISRFGFLFATTKQEGRGR